MLTPAPGSTTADAVADAARAMDPSAPLTFVMRIGDDDAYHRGPVPGGALIVVPGIWSGMPPRLLASMRARRACAVLGRCPECDTCADLTVGEFPHEPRCSVSDSALHPILTAWSQRVGKYARGARITELPA